MDDEPNVLTSFRMILERDGHRVTTADSYREGSAKLKKSSFDVVITDLNLEQDSLGLRLAQEAKLSKSRPVTVIYTGYPELEQLRRALQLRVDYCAFKPVDVDEIKNALSRLMMRRATLMETALNQ